MCENGGNPRSSGGRPILEVSGLSKHFPIRSGFLQKTIGQVRAVDDVNAVVMAGDGFLMGF